MSQPTGALVLTTIFDPALLDEYRDNFETHGHLDRASAYVIPDRKTPREAYERCARLKQRGLSVHCPTLEEQETFLSRFGRLKELIPYNSDNRRNIGYLLALEAGVDFVMSIDDDNHCRAEDDFFGEHAVVCAGPQTRRVVNSASGWFNVCDMLELDPPARVYPRGLPYHKRHLHPEPTYSDETVDVRVNAGLWLLDPDLDAMTWLISPVQGRALASESLVMGDRAWTPVNTQNTGLRRDVIPSYYFLPMGYPMAGMPIDRYGDIFSGYFAQKCARHLGHAIRFGSPLADHKRNTHNYLKDATNEMACIWTLEELTDWLVDARLEGDTYVDAFVSLSHGIEEAVEKFNGFIWTDATRGYFHRIAYGMREWADACRRILG